MTRIACVVWVAAVAGCGGRTELGQRELAMNDASLPETTVRDATADAVADVLEEPPSSPPPLPSPRLALGSQHTCAMNKTGKVYCWGDNSTGAIGNGEYGDYGGQLLRRAVRRCIPRVFLLRL